eukprot:366531-Chlamydomonas_euryale.AAC.12
MCARPNPHPRPPMPARPHTRLAPRAQAVICATHLLRLGDGDVWFSVVVAAQHVLLWSKLQYYARYATATWSGRAGTGRVEGQPGYAAVVEAAVCVHGAGRAVQKGTGPHVGVVKVLLWSKLQYVCRKRGKEKSKRPCIAVVIAAVPCAASAARNRADCDPSVEISRGSRYSSIRL